MEMGSLKNHLAKNHLARLGRQLPAGLRLLSLAWALGALTQLVWNADRFSHDGRYLEFLREHGLQGWIFAVVWAVLFVFRQRLDAGVTARLFCHTPTFTISLVGILVVLATPFTNAYFTHVTHPTLAVAMVWVLWPLFERGYTWACARVGELCLHRAWEPTLAFVVCACVIFVQSYRRHLWFGTGGKDLGLFHQSVWLLSQLESPHNTVMGMHAFADHLEFVDILAAPLQWLWPSAGALLLFQALVVGAGAAPVFSLARMRLESRAAGWALVVVYLFGVDLQHAVMFDWNPTTCGAGIIPWVVWFFRERRPVAFGVALGLVAICKENLVLYALALCLVLALEKGKERRWAMVGAATLAVFFVIEMKVLFPLFRPDGFRHFRFEELGNGPLEMLAAVVANPYRAFSMLFTPGAKVDGLLAPLSTVAFVCLLAPRWFIAFAPIVFERFWSTHSNRWWGYHYGAGIGVFATLAAIDGLVRLRQSARSRGGQAVEWSRMAVPVVVLSCLLVSTLARFGSGPLWSWRQSYYATSRDRRDAMDILRMIPTEASVAAQNHLLPYLSGRAQIYQIVLGDGAGPLPRHVEFVSGVAEFVVLDVAQSAWPKPAAFAKELGKALRERGYGVKACQGAAVLLQRGAIGIACTALD